VLGLEPRDVDLAAGAVRGERALHEFHDGSLDLGPTKKGDPRKVYLQLRRKLRGRDSNSQPSG
jgi:hypothetical protein